MGRSPGARLSPVGRRRRLAGIAGPDRTMRTVARTAAVRCRTGADAGYALPETEALGQGATPSGTGIIRRNRARNRARSASETRTLARIIGPSRTGGHAFQAVRAGYHALNAIGKSNVSSRN